MTSLNWGLAEPDFLEGRVPQSVGFFPTDPEGTPIGADHANLLPADSIGGLIPWTELKTWNNSRSVPLAGATNASTRSLVATLLNTTPAKYSDTIH